MNTATLLLLASSFYISFGQDAILYNAMTHGANAKVRLHVVDQDGKPVPEAVIHGWITTGGGISDYAEVYGNADGQGDYHMTMEVSFTNYPCAGAYLVGKDSFSDFQSVYQADTNAMYISTLTYTYDRSPGVRARETILDEDHYLVFRTRTKTNEVGNLCSANYGAIFGKWSFVGPKGMNIEQFVFNVNPNDTTLEDIHSADYSRMAQ